MAKNMVILDGNKVINVAVFPDLEAETAERKNCGDMPVCIGDTYVDGNYYRDLEVLRSDTEIATEILVALSILGVNM